MRERAVAGGLFLLVLALGTWLSFTLPCGCYAGTPAKDVPARCLDIGSPTRGKGE